MMFKYMRKLFLPLPIIALCAILAPAQDGTTDGSPQNALQAGQTRLGIVARALQLTEDQKQEYRRINMRQKEELRIAQAAFRLAREEADVAIYRDEFDEADVISKVRKVAEAQANITGIRLRSEVAVRGILSPQQLIKFRELRENFANAKRRAVQRRNQNRRNNQTTPRNPGGF